jgi:hypothetical protein
MIRFVGAVAFGAVAVIAGSRSALADAFTVNSYSVPNYVNVTINSSSPAPAVSEGGEAGAISINVTDTTTSTTSQMTVWCADIAAILSTPASYTSSTLSAQIGQTGYATLDSIKVNQVNALLNAVSSGAVSAINATSSAALAVAIWEVVYQTGDSGYNVTAGNFYVTSYGSDDISAVVSDANNYLTYITNGTWLPNTNDVVDMLQSTTGTDQNLVYLGVNTTSHSSVPEPGSLILLATGLLGFGALRNRRFGTV